MVELVWRTFRTSLTKGRFCEGVTAVVLEQRTSSWMTLITKASSDSFRFHRKSHNQLDFVVLSRRIHKPRNDCQCWLSRKWLFALTKSNTRASPELVYNCFAVKQTSDCFLRKRKHEIHFFEMTISSDYSSPRPLHPQNLPNSLSITWSMRFACNHANRFVKSEFLIESTVPSSHRSQVGASNRGSGASWSTTARAGNETALWWFRFGARKYCKIVCNHKRTMSYQPVCSIKILDRCVNGW